MSIAAKTLVVEDEIIVALDIKKELVRMGFPSPLIASSREDALRMAEESRPDVVLMDITLANEPFGGITAAAVIAEQYDIPVIYVTAQENEETVRRVKDTEMYGYILKPIHYRELGLAIEFALHRHKTARQLREQRKWLTTIVRSIGDGIIATDEKENIVLMNPAAERMTGWHEEEARGLSYDRIVHTISRSAAASGPEFVWGYGQASLENKRTMLVARDGKEREVTRNVWILKHDNGGEMGKVFVIKEVNQGNISEWSTTPRIL